MIGGITCTPVLIDGAELEPFVSICRVCVRVRSDVDGSRVPSSESCSRHLLNY